MDVETILQESATLAEARPRVRELLAQGGRPVSDRYLDAVIEAALGGDVAYVDDRGVPLHPLARKFARELGARSPTRRRRCDPTDPGMRR